MMSIFFRLRAEGWALSVALVNNVVTPFLFERLTKLNVFSVES